MKRHKLSDGLLAASIAIGLAYKFAALAILAAPLAKGKFGHCKWRIGHLFLLLSALWGVLVIASRGIGDSRSFLLQQSFLWVVPFVMLIFRPTRHTVHSFAWLIFGVFFIDLFFNVYALFSGHDLLGRALDLREGLAGGRLGGLFAHSFYSGNISLLAYVFAICDKRTRWLAMFAAANLIMAGSLRFAILLALVPYFSWGWKRRRRASELTQVALISVVAVLAIFVTSSFGGFGFAANPANDLRVFAWVNAFNQIARSPWYGVGYPNTAIEQADTYTVVDSNIGESWYLNSALAFGLPYMMPRLLGLLLIFYRRGFENRSAYEAVMVPVILVDLAYGGAFEALLFYATLWVVVDHDATKDHMQQESLQAVRRWPRLRFRLFRRPTEPYPTQ